LIINGYYEWEETKTSAQPFFIHNKKEEKKGQKDDVLYVACLYNNVFTEKLGDSYNHFVVLTVEAKGSLSKIHHRTPVILDEHCKDLWLDSNVDFKDCFKEIIKSDVYEGLDFYEVGELVNTIKNDKPECLMEKNDYEALVHKRGLGRFFKTIPKEDILEDP
jgi:putative SOS response-associated peptidase YedK